MKQSQVLVVAILVTLLVLPLTAGAGPAAPLAGAPTVISYQGQISVDGTPFSGTAHFKYAIVSPAGDTSYWSNDGTSASGGEPSTSIALAVNNGLFSVLLGDTTLDGMTQPLTASVFAATDRSLRVWFSTDGTTFSQLAPDHRIASVPYALQAEEAKNAWALNGNAGTWPGTNYLGTSDNQPLELKVNGERALRLEPNATTPNLIGGHAANLVGAGLAGVTIGGGGLGGTGCGDSGNESCANEVMASWSTIGGGFDNIVTGWGGTIAGGNTNTATLGASVGGGWRNTASGEGSCVGGGSENTASEWACVGGGYGNSASGFGATVGGGGWNTASGQHATVPGGEGNVAGGNYSFAAGNKAEANHHGAFVWADATGADFTSTADNQFAVRANGGVVFSTGTAPVKVNGNTVWHAGNDGAASALDADTVDGKHAAELNDPLRRASAPLANAATIVGAAEWEVDISITIGVDGLPLISYTDYPSRYLKVLHCGNAACTAGNTATIVDTCSGFHSSITIGADGLPVVSYYDSTNGDLKVLHCGDAACTTGNIVTTVDTPGDVGWYSSISIGADGLPTISYYDNTNHDLKVLHCWDAACAVGNTNTAVDTESVVSWATSITVGADGLPVISYWDTTNYDLKVLHCGNPTCTLDNTTTTVDSDGNVGSYSSITIGVDGLPVISYFQYQPNGDLRVLHCGNAACTADNTITAVDTELFVGEHTSITIGADGLPIVSYRDLSNGDLKVLHCGNAVCAAGNTAMAVDTEGDVGLDTSITIGTDGLPIISYIAYGSAELKVLHCASTFCTPYFRRR